MSDKRTLRINIRINEHVAEKLERYSKALGMASSTVAAQFLCEGLLAKETQAKALEAVLDQQLSYSNSLIDEILSDPEKLAKMLKSLGVEQAHLLDK